MQLLLVSLCSLSYESGAKTKHFFNYIAPKYLAARQHNYLIDWPSQNPHPQIHGSWKISRASQMKRDSNIITLDPLFLLKPCTSLSVKNAQCSQIANREKALAISLKGFTIVSFHSPPYTSSSIDYRPSEISTTTYQESTYHKGLSIIYSLPIHQSHIGTFHKFVLCIYFVTCTTFSIMEDTTHLRTMLVYSLEYVSTQLSLRLDMRY